MSSLDDFRIFKNFSLIFSSHALFSEIDFFLQFFFESFKLQTALVAHKMSFGLPFWYRWKALDLSFRKQLGQIGLK